MSVVGLHLDPAPGTGPPAGRTPAGLDSLRPELEAGLSRYWSTAATILEGSGIALAESGPEAFSVEGNFFSLLFLYSYVRAGVPVERRTLFVTVNQCLRGMVTGCDNLLDDEYKVTLQTDLPARAVRFRSVLDVRRRAGGNDPEGRSGADGIGLVLGLGGDVGLAQASGDGGQENCSRKNVDWFSWFCFLAFHSKFIARKLLEEDSGNQSGESSNSFTLPTPESRLAIHAGLLGGSLHAGRWLNEASQRLVEAITTSTWLSLRAEAS